MTTAKLEKISKLISLRKLVKGHKRLDDVKLKQKIFSIRELTEEESDDLDIVWKNMLNKMNSI